MPLDTQFPAWLRDEISWVRGIGDEPTKTLMTGLAVGSTLLKQKEQRENLALQNMELENTQKDMNTVPVWLASHPNPSPTDFSELNSMTSSRWGQQKANFAWQQSIQEQQLKARQDAVTAQTTYRDGLIRNGSVASKEALKTTDTFTKALIDTQIPSGDLTGAKEKAAILKMLPKGEAGMPPDEAWDRLTALQQKYPARVKATAETNEGKNIDLLNRLKAAGDTEGAALVENILKARGHLGTDKAPGGKLSAVDASRMKEGEADLTRADKALDAAEKAVSAASRPQEKADAQAEYKKAFERREMAHGALENIRKKYEGGVAAPAGSKPIKAPSVSLPKVRTQSDIDAALQQANDAIKAGADPDQVKKRLKDMGIKLKGDDQETAPTRD